MPLAALLMSFGSAAAVDEGLWDHTKLVYPTLREVTLPDVERIVLPNGMVLYLLEDHEFPTVSGQMLIRAGSMLDPTDKVGLAQMTGTVLRTGGSEKNPGDEVDRMLEGIGASVEFGLGQRQTIDELRVRWPGGIEEIHLDPPINSFLVVTEGGGVAVE